MGSPVKRAKVWEADYSWPDDMEVVAGADYDALEKRFRILEWERNQLRSALEVKEEFYQDALHSHVVLASQCDALREEKEHLAAHLADAESRAENAGRNASAFEERMGDLQVENGKLRDEVDRLRGVLSDDVRVRHYKEYLDRKRDN